MIFLIVGVVFVIGLAVAILYFKVLFRVLWWMASTLAIGAWLGLAWVTRKVCAGRDRRRQRDQLEAMSRRVDDALATQEREVSP
jgi:hypothetical protein